MHVKAVRGSGGWPNNKRAPAAHQRRSVYKAWTTVCSVVCVISAHSARIGAKKWTAREQMVSVGYDVLGGMSGKSQTMQKSFKASSEPQPLKSLARHILVSRFFSAELSDLYSYMSPYKWPFHVTQVKVHSPLLCYKEMLLSTWRYKLVHPPRRVTLLPGQTPAHSPLQNI